jgi:hypothetical protein
VSGYLMRLVTRGAQGRPMQPLVRSTSPVAERDQRIGMMGFEGLELGESSLAETGSETGLNRTTLSNHRYQASSQRRMRQARQQSKERQPVR